MTEVRTLGECRTESPLSVLLGDRRTTRHYVDEDDRVLVDDTIGMVQARREADEQLASFEPGGPRRRIYFDPAKTRAAVVTCGGLCPGLNDVIRGLVLELHRAYGVRRVLGFRNGYQGFVPSFGHDVVDLTPASVAGIDEKGGTVLGTSRGDQDPEVVADCLERMDVDVLFVVGGDGSMRGAMAMSQVLAARGSHVAVVGVPKTVDNDLPFIDASFGFQTAFGRASESIRAAHTEARSTPNGVGLVKLMGRHSGFIACYAALATSDSDFVLVPEVPFALEGEDGVLAHVRRRVAEQGHALVVVAEGAGQEHLDDGREERDASGNVRLRDIGGLLRERIGADFAANGQALSLRYIDPSYAIRSVPANPSDSVYCLRLAHAAVHAAMAGRTEVVVGRWHGRFVHVPMALAVSERNVVSESGDLWLAVLESTGQPARFGDAPAAVAGH